MDYYPLMTLTFRNALMGAVEKSGKSLKAVAEGAGVSYEQLKKLNQYKSKSTNVDDAVRVAGFFGMTLDQFLEDDAVIIRSEIVDLYNQLTDQERLMILGAVKAALASRVSGKQ